MLREAAPAVFKARAFNSNIMKIYEEFKFRNLFFYRKRSVRKTRTTKRLAKLIVKEKKQDKE